MYNWTVYYFNKRAETNKDVIVGIRLNRPLFTICGVLREYIGCKCNEQILRNQRILFQVNVDILLHIIH